MKLLIRSSVITCFVITTVLCGACSNETTTIQTKNNHVKAQNETQKQQSPRLLVQQFGGCKAHQ
ncbi:MAG: hypothetical protein QE487_16395 [Fluviicola sp.]|nr:hypothetical protein [Fluviicola sp.]